MQHAWASSEKYTGFQVKNVGRIGIGIQLAVDTHQWKSFWKLINYVINPWGITNDGQVAWLAE